MTTPKLQCPEPYDLNVYQYDTSDYFTLQYPVEGYDVLKGSGKELTIPPEGDQEIRLIRENTVFLRLSFSVRYAESATLWLTQSDLQTTTVQHPASPDAVS